MKKEDKIGLTLEMIEKAKAAAKKMPPPFEEKEIDGEKYYVVPIKTPNAWDAKPCQEDPPSG